MSEVKLTKKQLKAQQFRKTKEVKDAEKIEALSKPATTSASAAAVDGTSSGEPVKKKRKTRRGRGGKGRNGSNSKNRFIVFVGGLPRECTNTELQAHFKSSNPDLIRIRNDKHIAFLEFDGDKDPSGIQGRMDIALLQHRTLMRDNKRINVELTVGGGGNSQDRLNKLKEKNEKLDVERRERLTNIINKKNAESKKNQKDNGEPKTHSSNIHPDRAKLLQ